MKKWRVVAEVDNITDDIAEALGRKIYVQAVEYTVDAEALREVRDKGCPAPIRSIKQVVEYTVEAETLREARDKGRPAPGWHIRSIKEIADEGAEAPR